jgi:NodT family efflux transporter outer membrane factor (OMF) lipoprotein
MRRRLPNNPLSENTLNWNECLMRKLFVAAMLSGLSACAVGPDYQRPESAAPAAFKEVAGWKPAQPQAEINRGEWWVVYGDSTLNDLIAELNAGNQDIRAAEARYRQARALVQSARAGFLPTVSASAAVTRGSSSTSSSQRSALTGNAATGNSSGQIDYERTAALDASWELDVWGRVRRNVEASGATAAASAADLASTQLSAQSELAINYFQLRILDARQALFDRTVAAYDRSRLVSKNRYEVGVVSRADVVQAETQLRSAQADALDNRLQRAQLEHAIAVLLGKAPADFSLQAMPLADSGATLAEQSLPVIPPALPSTLLERRPDIAAAEQRVIAANAEIGLAQAAYFPTISLDATGGYRSSSAADWLTVPNRFWSVGPSLLLTLFDGGARSAEKRRAEAVYDETVATYRQAVLTGFQEVEDNLAALSWLEQQAQQQDAAVQAARESVDIVLNQYKAGKVGYLDVINVQTIAFSNERTALQILGQRYSASVALIKALGGNW